MNYLKLLLVSLFLSSYAFAQSGEGAELLAEQEKQRTYLEQQKKSTLRHEENYKKSLAVAKEKQLEFDQLQNYEENFAQSRVVALAELDDEISNFNFFQKLSGKAKFYKCLKSSLEQGVLTYKSCENRFGPNLSEEDKKKSQNWNKTTGIDPKLAAEKKAKLPEQISEANKKAETDLDYYQKSLGHEEDFKTRIAGFDKQRNELKLIPKYQNVINCDENTPEINLEEKVPYVGAEFEGPFYEVPRDNQDGLGTCYANAAKNLLVGISKGEDVASFLDMALQFKSSNNTLNSSGLDGGNSCSALDSMKTVGYCPQKYAHLETGERNELGEGLFNLGPYEYLARNVDMVRDFVSDLEKFEKNVSGVDKEILNKAQGIIETLKQNPDIQLPLPIASHEIPERWKLKEVFHLRVKDPKYKIESFLNDYEKAYQKFYPSYVKALLDDKNLDEIFEIYKKQMEPFLAKNNMMGDLEGFKNSFKGSVGNDINDPKLQSKLRVSLNYLKEVMDKKDLSDDSFLEYCSENGADGIRFLGALNPLIQKLRADALNGSQLFDKDGKFKSAKDLMQLTVAPSCLNAENRKPLPAFNCDTGYSLINKMKSSDLPYKEKIKPVREKIVLSLMQGYPLGNTFPTNGGYHINTIVGMRFNKTSKQCEYRIRESQNGTSNWLLEKPILDRIDALTQVRRP